MYKNIIKSSGLLFFMLFITFFININHVGAADKCSCWYYAEGYGYDPNTGIVDKATLQTYLVEMEYTAKSADVVFSCSSDTTSASASVSEAKKCDKNDNSINRGNPFEVDSGAIAKKNCSKAACNKAKIKLWCWHDIVTEGYNDPQPSCFHDVVDFKYITKKQAEAIINADDAAQEADNQGVSDNPEAGYDPAVVESIQKWGQIADEDSYTGEYSSGCDIIGEKVLKFLKNLFFIIQVIAIVLFIFLTALQFIKVITGSEDDGLSKALKNTLRRIIIVVIIILLPMLITWILQTINNNNYLTDEDGKVIIGDDNNPICRK